MSGRFEVGFILIMIVAMMDSSVLLKFSMRWEFCVFFLFFLCRDEFFSEFIVCFLVWSLDMVGLISCYGSRGRSVVLSILEGCFNFVDVRYFDVEISVRYKG